MTGDKDPARERQSRTLADGRRIGFAEYGDPAGKPVFFCHGWPGSRIEARFLAPAARALGARVIAADRPGYGASSHLQGRTLGGWSADVEELANALGLERFAVLGVSGGGPYALACAARLRDRVSRATVVCGVGPLAYAPMTAGMARGRRLACAMLRRAPFASWPLCYLVTRTLCRNASAGLDALSAMLPEQDQAVLRQAAVRETLVTSLAEAFSTGIQGASRDLRLYFQPWDFDLGNVTAKVALWHGESDVLVPPVSSRHLAALLPRSRLTLVPDAGHYSLPLDRAEEILGDLLARTDLG